MASPARSSAPWVEGSLDARPLGRVTSRHARSTLGDFNGQRVAGTFLVTIPYLELEQGQRVLDRLEAGDDPHTVLSEEVGVQNYPEWQFTMQFDPSFPAVTTHAQLTAADCHTIAAP